MKKFSFLAMAALGLLFAACSSDKDVADEKGGGMLDGKAEGYFKVSLNLPTAPVASTRSWQESESGTLADGLPKEYGVKTCVLLLFDGATETDATLTQVIDLTPNFSGVDDNPNQITTKGEYVAKLSALPSANLYALAVINGKGNIEFESATSIKLRGTSTSGCKIAALQAATAASENVSTNDFIFTEGTGENIKYYYFMTNAVLSNEPGGTILPVTPAGNLHILAPVDKSFIYDTEAKATAGQAAADIYVERGMAKVTIKSAELGVDALTAGAGVTISASLDGWCLDITNKSSYVVRQVPTGNIWNLKSYGTASVDEYRFIGENAVDKAYGTAIAGYRTYWAKDPNYNGDLTFDANNQNTTNFSYATYATDKETHTGDNYPLYCLENTFDVAHQDARYTTRAIIGVKLTSGTDFYIMGADRKTLYTLEAVEAKVLTSLMNTDAFSTWYATNGVGDLTASDVTITWDKATAGVIKVSTITIKQAKITGATADKVITAEEEGDLAGVINTVNGMLFNVERFVDGMTYYPIRIKHFGDDLTPWNKGEYGSGTAPAESTIATIYPDNSGKQDANYLGRYGMVRNNWYELVIGDILKVGYSEPPTIPSHPDDDLEDSYIKARINILSWAKRPQNWNLQ